MKRTTLALAVLLFSLSSYGSRSLVVPSFLMITESGGVLNTAFGEIVCWGTAMQRKATDPVNNTDKINGVCSPWHTYDLSLKNLSAVAQTVDVYLASGSSAVTFHSNGNQQNLSFTEGKRLDVSSELLTETVSLASGGMAMVSFVFSCSSTECAISSNQGDPNFVHLGSGDSFKRCTFEGGTGIEQVCFGMTSKLQMKLVVREDRGAVSAGIIGNYGARGGRVTILRAGLDNLILNGGRPF
jgi:hypothetical protein